MIHIQCRIRQLMDFHTIHSSVVSSLHIICGNIGDADKSSNQYMSRAGEKMGLRIRMLFDLMSESLKKFENQLISQYEPVFGAFLDLI